MSKNGLVSEFEGKMYKAYKELGATFNVFIQRYRTVSNIFGFLRIVYWIIMLLWVLLGCGMLYRINMFAVYPLTASFILFFCGLAVYEMFGIWQPDFMGKIQEVTDSVFKKKSYVDIPDNEVVGNGLVEREGSSEDNRKMIKASMIDMRTTIRDSTILVSFFRTVLVIAEIILFVVVIVFCGCIVFAIPHGDINWLFGLDPANSFNVNFSQSIWAFWGIIFLSIIGIVIHGVVLAYNIRTIIWCLQNKDKMPNNSDTAQILTMGNHDDDDE